METEKVFADGMIFKKKHDKAPDFVKGHVSIKVEDFVKQLEKFKDERGWVNYDLKLSKGGKIYFELNTWKPEKTDTPDIKDDEIPF